MKAELTTAGEPLKPWSFLSFLGHVEHGEGLCVGEANCVGVADAGACSGDERVGVAFVLPRVQPHGGARVASLSFGELHTGHLWVFHPGGGGAVDSPAGRPVFFVFAAHQGWYQISGSNDPV